MGSIPYSYIGDLAIQQDMDDISTRIGAPGLFSSMTHPYEHNRDPVFPCTRSTVEAVAAVYKMDYEFVVMMCIVATGANIAAQVSWVLA